MMFSRMLSTSTCLPPAPPPLLFSSPSQENLDTDWPLYVRGHDGVAKNIFIKVSREPPFPHDFNFGPFIFCSQGVLTISNLGSYDQCSTVQDSEVRYKTVKYGLGCVC